ncbi:NAD-dependent epimerase/dehydratase family protein [Rheinheimera texasensis]|uniref:NAD-dependent epimerase/dehydratase family protein n=1 Tax=Rheinheimera texasensis TaxID=306205 RepID=UPI0004E146FB|nr:NAD(P)-dependent oxidoreductase [Rheinheimera texasensis]
MKLFVSGISGFIGSALQRQLDPAQVTLSSISRSQNVPGGLKASFAEIAVVRSYLRETQPESAILLAWQGLPDYSPALCMENLNQQSMLILELLQAGCRRIVLAGSCWQYGQQSGAVNELMLPNQPGVFASTKNAVFQIADAMCRDFGATLAEARIFYSYGPGQRPQSLLPTLSAQIMQGDIPQVNTPYHAVDFIHVDDVARALLMLVERTSEQGIFNVGSGRAVSVAQIVNLMLESAGQAPIYQDTSPTQQWWADVSKLNRLGFSCQVQLHDGIRQIIANDLERRAVMGAT